MSRAVIDLFSGCGGLSLGARWAGFEPVLAVERSDMAAETYAANIHGTDFRELDWRKHVRRSMDPGANLADVTAELPVLIRDIRAVATQVDFLSSFKGVDLVAGGPPCQGFSMAGRRQKGDLRNELPWSFLEIVEAVEPKAVIVENVVGINRSFLALGGDPEDAPPFIQLWRQLEQTGPGYVVQPVEVNARHFGVPQSRPRMMLIALRADLATGHAVSSGAIWRSRDAWCSDEVEIPDLAPRMGLPREAAEFAGADATRDSFTVMDAFADLGPDGYAWGDPDDARYGTAPYARLMRRHPSGPTVDGLRNHVARSHTTPVTRRFMAYHHLAELGVRPNSVMRLAADARDRFSETEWRSRAREAIASVFLDRNLSLDLPASQFDDVPDVIRRELPALGAGARDIVDVIIELTTKKHSQRVVAGDMPSPTVVTLPDDHVHPRYPRTMTVRELARLQSFPDWFEFRSKETTGSHRRRVEVPQYSQVGNAVPPLMAQAVASRLAAVLDDAEKSALGPRPAAFSQRRPSPLTEPLKAR